jgi:hypothetical protein
MATVPDKSGNTRLDKKYSHPNRNNAGTPIGALVPAYPNELVLDTTNFLLWRAIGTTNANWIPVGESLQ